MIAMWEVKGGGAWRLRRSSSARSRSARELLARRARAARRRRRACTTSTRPTPSTASTPRWASGARELPFVTLLAGLLGLCFAFTFQFYTAVFDWPLDVGGKPENSTLAFVPVCFELTVLIGGLGTVGAFLLRARLYPGKRERAARRWA